MSPIRGLSDRGLSFPEIGQIRKGAPKDETKNRPGKDLDYFRVEIDPRETEAVQTFKKVYGDKPDSINVILPFNEIDKMWEAWLEAYTAGRMVARSDGEYFVYLVDTKTGEVLVKNGLDKKGNKMPYTDKQVVGKDYKKNEIRCKPVGRLKVIVPELARAAYMTVLTTSINDIANISEQLSAFQELNSGTIAGIPFVLRRRPKKISRPGENGQRIRVEKWLLSIEADPTWGRAKLSQVKRLALPGNGLEHEEIVESTLIEVEDEWEPPNEVIEEEQPTPPEPEPIKEKKQTIKQTSTPPPPPEPEPVSDPCWTEPEAPPEPPEAVPSELQKAFDLAGNDGVKYEMCSVFELTRRTKGMNALWKTETDYKKQNVLLQHLDALKLVLEYRQDNMPVTNS